MRLAGLAAGLALLGACRNPLDVGGLGLVVDSPDGGDAAVGPDVLEVRVVDDRPILGTGEPLADVRVVVVDATGLHEGVTDADGHARIAGLDFAAEPPDVTFAAAGYASLTIVDLGSMGPIPSPIEVGLGSLDFCPSCSWAPAVTGPCVRHDEGSTVVASLPGGWGESGSENYVVRRDPGLPGPLDLVGVEIVDGRVVGFGRAACLQGECDAEHPRGPSLPTTTVPGTGTVTVSLETDVADDPDLGGVPARVRVVDENEQGRQLAVLGPATLADPERTSTLALPYADEGHGVALGVWAEILSANGAILSAARVPAAASETLRFRQPPHIVADSPLVLPRDAIQIEGGGWAQARGVVLSDTRQILWVVVLPPGSTSVRLPFRPSLDFVDVAAVAIEWDEGPWENLRGFGARWSGTHLRALASDASVAADVQ